MIQFLEFLRSHNDLYSDIEINPANIPVDILGLQRFKTEEDTIYSKLLKCLDEPIEIASACEMEEGIVVAPGEGKKPDSILNDKLCEELVIHICFLLVNMSTKLKGKFQ